MEPRKSTMEPRKWWPKYREPNGNRRPNPTGSGQPRRVSTPNNRPMEGEDATRRRAMGVPENGLADMPWMARMTKHRLIITTTNDMKMWIGRGWNDERTCLVNSLTAVLRLRQARELALYSQNCFPQRIIFINREDETVVGTIEVTSGGGIVAKRRPAGATLREQWPIFWSSQTVAIVGIRNPTQLRVWDMQGRRDSVITWNTGYDTWLLPGELLQVAGDHDVDPPTSSESESGSGSESDEMEGAVGGRTTDVKQSSGSESGRKDAKVRSEFDLESTIEMLGTTESKVDDATSETSSGATEQRGPVLANTNIPATPQSMHSATAIAVDPRGSGVIELHPQCAMPMYIHLTNVRRPFMCQSGMCKCLDANVPEYIPPEQKESEN